MKYALHGCNTQHSNILSDIALAGRTGYDGIELHTSKFQRMLTLPHSDELWALTKVKEALAQTKLEVSCIDIIPNLEASTVRERDMLYSTAEKWIQIAIHIGAPCIQLNAFNKLDALSVQDNIRIISQNIRQILTILSHYNMRFQYEGAAWTPLYSLGHLRKLCDAVGDSRFGIVLDFWHLFAGQSRDAEAQCSPSDLKTLSKEMIFSVHCSDGKRNDAIVPGQPWDEVRLRDYLIGDGDIPLNEWKEALIAMGFDGWIVGEFLGYTLWEQDHHYIATEMLARAKKIFG